MAKAHEVIVSGRCLSLSCAPAIRDLDLDSFLA